MFLTAADMGVGLHRTLKSEMLNSYFTFVLAVAKARLLVLPSGKESGPLFQIQRPPNQVLRHKVFHHGLV